jgi:hypothetical protein
LNKSLYLCTFYKLYEKENQTQRENTKPRRRYSKMRLDCMEERDIRWNSKGKSTVDKRVILIGGMEANFISKIGPAYFQSKKVKDNFIFETDYKYLNRKYGLNGIPAPERMQPKVECHSILENYCRNNNFEIEYYINTWPIYRTVISKKKD